MVSTSLLVSSQMSMVGSKVTDMSPRIFWILLIFQSYLFMMSLFSCVHISLSIFSCVLSSGLYSGESYVISIFGKLSGWSILCHAGLCMQNLLTTPLIINRITVSPGTIMKWGSVIFPFICVNCRGFSLVLMSFKHSWNGHNRFLSSCGSISTWWRM